MAKSVGMIRGTCSIVACIAVAVGLVGCESYLNQTASLGGSVAGQRGTLRVLFINNTPFQAVFTYGSYDQNDQDAVPDFEQFGLQEFPAKLDAGSTSSISVDNDRAFLQCARVFAIGSDRLHDLIRRHFDEADLVAESMVEGVEFYEVLDPAGEAEDPQTDPPTSAGFAAPFEALLGVDFPCQALLIVRFEHDEQNPAPFRVDFELIPAESDR